MIGISDWNDNVNWLDAEDADIEAYCATVKDDFEFNLAEKFRHWREFGFVILEDVVDHKLIDELIGDVEHVRQHNLDYDLGVELRGKQGKLTDFTKEELDFDGVKFNSLHTISSAAAELSLTKSICDFLVHVFKDSPAVLQSLSFYKGSQQPPHTDYPFVRTQSIIPHLAGRYSSRRWSSSILPRLSQCQGNRIF
jgi:phytanoyl-CoA hydroxylase